MAVVTKTVDCGAFFAFTRELLDVLFVGSKFDMTFWNEEVTGSNLAIYFSSTISRAAIEFHAIVQILYRYTGCSDLCVVTGASQGQFHLLWPLQFLIICRVRILPWMSILLLEESIQQ